MSAESASRRIILGVGAVVRNSGGEVLLIRRAKSPLKGQWSLPGGKVEFGENLRAAAAREVREETGLAVEILELIDVAEFISDAGAGTENGHYVLVDFAARVTGGELAAASDAADASWFALPELDALPLWSETRRIIALSAKMPGSKY